MTVDPKTLAVALDCLRIPKFAPREAAFPSAPGLYAIHGVASVWIDLGLGHHQDSRPLYVGKAEDSLASRDIRTHFSSGRTGSSTLRRSLAALLREHLELRACPRNRLKPDGSANYGLEEPSDNFLTEWMLDHLRLGVWIPASPCNLDEVETAVLLELYPPLNIAKIKTQWTKDLKRRRENLAAEARAWNPVSGEAAK